jgi:predicted RND superfamily exporter protein
MSRWVAGFVFRWRLPLCAVVVVGFFYFAPSTNFTEIDNDLTMWVSQTDPVYVTYERFRREFGGQRSLIVALRSKELFSPASLGFIRAVTGDIERVRTVERVQSLATANIVRSLPEGPEAGDEGGIEVEPLLGESIDVAAAAAARQTVLDDPLLRGDLVSEDGTVTALVVTFDEDRIDDVRAGVIEEIHQLVDPSLPAGMEAFYNGSLEISETYNRVTLDNTRNLTGPILALMIAAIYVLFRSWRITCSPACCPRW